MKSTTNVRPRQPRAEADLNSAIEAAAALIALAMHESLTPVGDLSSSLARMAGILGASGAGELDRASLTRELSICVESLQFHDRLTQQLTQVRNLLASIAADTLPIAAVEPESWLVLVENLRARFTSDSHRILFNLLLPVSGGHMAAPSLHANEGSVELF
jgi:hypothetical protein